jgi:hypothetical protein
LLLVASLPEEFAVFVSFAVKNGAIFAA